MRGFMSGIASLCLIASLAAAQDVALAPSAPDKGDHSTAARGAAAVHIPLVQRLLADPAIRNHVGLTENHWDFTSPDGVPGFGPMEAGPSRSTTAVRSRD
jgi:hypothetical protein